jgi:glycosyltransferase involved in cell wall biosynthesis
LAGIFAGERPDIMLVYSPPLFLGLTAILSGLTWHFPFVFWVNDLWPRAALSLGFMREGLFYQLARKMETLIYHRAARIFVYSHHMAREVAAGGASPDKIEVHPLWIDTEVFCPDPAEGQELRRKFGWQDKFVVMYGGNIGLAQGLEVLVAAGALLRHLPAARLVLMGSGPEKARLRELAAQQGLSNVEFLDHQPKEKVKGFFSAADLLFAHLKAAPHRVGTVPEKILAYMACGRPVLLAAQEGAAAALVQQHHCGLAISPDNPGELARAIEYGYGHRQECEAMALAGHRAAATHFSGPKVLREMESRLADIVARAQ